MKVFYLTVEGISSTVFDSQVYSLTESFATKGIDMSLIIGQKLKARVSITKFIKLVLKNNISFLFFKTKIDYKKTSSKILKMLPKNQPVILHCRNIEAAYIGLLIKNTFPEKLEIIYDVRGYVEGEKIFFNDQKKATIFLELNKKLFSSISFYSFVSSQLYDVYNNIYDLSSKNVIFCNSAYDDKIFNIDTSINNKPNNLIKVLFVGGNQTYQRTEEIIEFCKEKPNIQLTVVTPKALFKKDSSILVYKHNLSQKQISLLANDFDYGIIYRSNEVFNQVATPTKVTEYWGKGLKILAINSAGAYNSVIEKNNFLGEIFKTKEQWTETILQKQTLNDKIKINTFAKNNFSQSKNIERYSNFYNSILN